MSELRKHTPGPWSSDEFVIFSTKGGAIPDTEEICTVACFPDIDTHDEHYTAMQSESVANARLIAAAPDLLEACKAADRQFSKFIRDGAEVRDYPILVQLRAAIAKADTL